MTSSKHVCSRARPEEPWSCHVWHLLSPSTRSWTDKKAELQVFLKCVLPQAESQPGPSRVQSPDFRYSGTVEPGREHAPPDCLPTICYTNVSSPSPLSPPMCLYSCSFRLPCVLRLHQQRHLELREPRSGSSCSGLLRLRFLLFCQASGMAHLRLQRHVSRHFPASSAQRALCTDAKTAPSLPDLHLLTTDLVDLRGA